MTDEKVPLVRDSFGSTFGAIAAAAGAAVGLGNIWNFPYMTGRNGGGAFLLIYVLAVVLIGVPIMISEKPKRSTICSVVQPSALRSTVTG